MIKAGVPEDRRAAISKPDIAIEEIDRIMAAGVRFGCVLADEGYGLSAGFRQALSARNLRWAVGIPRHQKVYAADVALILPVAVRGRARLRHIPDRSSLAAHKMLDSAKWRQVSCRRGRLSARFAAMRVRIADGGPSALAPQEPCICPVKRSGWSANIVRMTSEDTISPTCLPTYRSNNWQGRSRRDGSASRPTSNLRKSLVSIISRADHGPGFTDTAS